MLLRYQVWLAFSLLSVGGCTSMSSTMLTRDESNQFWTRKGNLKGVPITLKVPTHVQLTIFERHFLYKNPECDKIQRLPLKYVVRDFAQEFIYTEKIFTVDFKRPAAGLYNLNLNLTDDQYIQSLQYDVTDQTIQNVTTLMGKLVPGTGGLNAVTASATTENLVEIQSVVAVDMFEIDAPDFEQQMTNFINCHLNQTHDAWAVPPGVPGIYRAPLSGFQGASDICGGMIAPDMSAIDRSMLPLPCPPNPAPLLGPPNAAPLQGPPNAAPLQGPPNAAPLQRPPVPVPPPRSIENRNF